MEAILPLFHVSSRCGACLSTLQSTRHVQFHGVYGQCKYAVPLNKQAKKQNSILTVTPASQLSRMFNYKVSFRGPDFACLQHRQPLRSPPYTVTTSRLDSRTCSWLTDRVIAYADASSQHCISTGNCSGDSPWTPGNFSDAGVLQVI